MLRIGTEAPDFTAALGSGGALTLSDLRGQNVVLYFYPRAFTHGCTAQAKGFCAALPAITAADAIVVGISTDDADTLYRFRNAFDLPFDLVTDASGEIRKLYDVRRRFGLGTSRVTYVIDRQGVIRGAFHNEVSMSSHINNTLDALAAIG